MASLLKSSAPQASVFTAQCSSRAKLCLLGNKWSLLILRALGRKSLRFTDLHQRVGGISEKMLAQTLRQLEGNGLVVRKVYPDSPVRVDYALTPKAKQISEAIATICRWAEGKRAAAQTKKT